MMMMMTQAEQILHASAMDYIETLHDFFYYLFGIGVGVASANANEIR